MKTNALFLVLLLSLSTALLAQTPASWTKPIDPFHIAGNIYYVGTEELAAYLITDEDGLILLDAPMDENVDLILRNIETLGFDPKKIRYLIASHAHVDHIGGFAAMQKRTGAKVLLSRKDAELAVRGGKGDIHFGDSLTFPPVVADAPVEDGEIVSVGKARVRAILTPGHTPGCTTWMTSVLEGKQIHNVVFLCSLTAPGYKLVGNEKAPNLMNDYRTSIEKLRAVDADIFLANHASFFDLHEKIAAKKSGNANAFVVPGEFTKFLDWSWSALQKQEAKQRAETK